MDNDKAAQVIGTPEGFQFPLPLHSNPVKRLRSEILDGDTIRYDPETAHARAGDTGYEKSLPESCGLCRATQISQEASSTSGPEAIDG